MNQTIKQNLLIIIKNKSVVFLLTLLGVFALLVIADNRVYPHDSGHYFRLSMSFIQDGRFSVFNFPLNLRGIIFPLVLLPFNIISNIILGDYLYGWRILISVMSAFFAISFPTLFKGIGKTYLFPIPLLMLGFVFYGIFLAPLADLVSLFFLVYALALISFGYSRWEEKQSKNQALAILLFVVSGIFLYAAYNTRTIYLFAGIGILLIVIFNKPKIKNMPEYTKRIIFILAVLLGVFLGGLPQAVSNLHTIGAFSFGINTDQWQAHVGRSLNLFQLETGLMMNLYETWMGGGLNGLFIITSLASIYWRG